ncbi:hypothetical protein AGABI2DRAFT_188351 [Agaricus bisporus var. bisporus H97]|uniref:hypothetical protein n=1 Tax=Agaricus bisporus var. bisporus (strain H97 / ATCC MYA-4626 / FGSC 10389) TaxID=936046 RepID=UPI00029F781A|nr:hypothetical protein AGABI2DRAFT_188351 [Agaricus bisporus var. bisporus H97]EKV42716.1 hypothetical protein AGABI2DRAFT_188351 [Agaricus bisporus var. bisporus H97]
MKFTLAIIPPSFALSAFGSPVEPNARQMPMCNFTSITQCISAIATNPAAIIPPCPAASGILNNIQQAQAQGKPPSETDQLSLVSSGLRCLAASLMAGFAAPAVCYDCLGGLSGIPAPSISS